MTATSADIAAPDYVNATEHISESFDEVAFDDYFGLLSNETLVIIRPYTGDDDDKVLEELRPKYIVMYDPDPSYVRRIEVSFVAFMTRMNADSNYSASELLIKDWLFEFIL